jgi:hypothetical protein
VPCPADGGPARGDRRGQSHAPIADLETAATLADLRRACRMRTQSLCDALAELVGTGKVVKSDAGYRLA